MDVLEKNTMKHRYTIGVGISKPLKTSKIVHKDDTHHHHHHHLLA